MNLNLGCGNKILPGYCNVDKFGSPDMVWDLEKFPWPWGTNSADEILLHHVLEHLGQSPETFLTIMQEIYRIGRHGALVKIAVPHPRHDHFIMDPTHVRAITPKLLSMFSKKANLSWKEKGVSNTPLALYYDVDFDIVACAYQLAEPYLAMHRDGKLSHEQIASMIDTLNNIVEEIKIDLSIVKS